LGSLVSKRRKSELRGGGEKNLLKERGVPASLLLKKKQTRISRRGIHLGKKSSQVRKKEGEKVAGRENFSLMVHTLMDKLIKKRQVQKLKSKRKSRGAVREKFF